MCVLRRQVVNCTVAATCCSGGPLSAAMVHFLARMSRERVTLRSTAAVLTRLAAFRIRQSSHSLLLTFQGFRVTPLGVISRVQIQLPVAQFCLPRRLIHRLGNC